MSKYVYKARDKQGKLVEGIVQAETSREVVTALNSKELIAISVERVEDIAEKKKIKDRVSKKSLKTKDISIFCRQMATMINAGVSVIEAVTDIGQTAANLKLRQILRKVANDIKMGSSLSESLKRHPHVFNKVFTSMMLAGEESGNLDVVLLDLSGYLEATVKLRRRIKAASMYPGFVATFMLATVAGLVFFLVPRFKKLFASLGAELPLPTKIVMWFSDAAVRNIHWIILILAGLVFLVYSFYQTKVGRMRIDRFLLGIPIMGMIMTKVVFTRFFQTMATLLKSGVDIVASLEIAGKVVDNVYVEKLINNIRLKIMEGSTMSGEMNREAMFPRIAIRMTAIGEKSGKLDEMFMKISEYYNDEVDATVEGLSSILEPVLIVILGVVVGMFVLAMYLPIFKMAMAMVSQGL
ncbi:MAG: type II secretion system F family protein [Elusimicrobiota bacterium]